MEESLGLTFYVWYWKLLVFLVVHPWAMVLFWVVFIITMAHCVKTVILDVNNERK